MALFPYIPSIDIAALMGNQTIRLDPDIRQMAEALQRERDRGKRREEELVDKLNKIQETQDRIWRQL